jgi:hypothetical protein
MHAPRPAAARSMAPGALVGRADTGAAPWVAFGVVASLVAAYILLALEHTSLALAASALCAAIAITWGLRRSSHVDVEGATTAADGQMSPGSAGLYLTLDDVEVAAVYVLGTELYTHLRGGVGRLSDPLTGDQRHIETCDVSLTWRCQGRRSAARLAGRLNEWEASRAPLRLLAARGRCALLMEDDQHWLALPELRLAS